MSKISELSNGGALLSTDDLIVVRSGGNVRAQLSSLNGIAIGSSTPAAGTFTSVSVDSITIDGNEIDVSSGDLTLDVAGDIILDADGEDIRFKDGGTQTFVFTMGTGSTISTPRGNLTLDVAGDIILDADNSDIILKDNGTTFGQFTNDSGNLIIYNSGSQMLKGLSGGSDAYFVGKLGIGQSSPSAPIDVVTNSTAYVGEFTQSNTSNGDGVFIQVGSTASADYALTVRSDAGNDSVLAAKADGHVGIGTFVPSHPLHITKEIGGYQAYFNNDNGSAQGLKVRIKANDSGNFNILDLVSASTGSDVSVMTVRDDGNATFSGNVTVGTSTAGVVEVGSANSFQIQKSGANGYINQSDSGSLIIRMGSSFDEAMRINSNRTIAINSTATNRELTIAAVTSSGQCDLALRAADDNNYCQLLFGDTSADNTGIVGYKNGDDFMFFYTNNAEAMRLTASQQLLLPGVKDDTTSDAANMNIRSSDGLVRRSTSSRRYKNTITDATHGLTELLNLRPVTYKGNNDGDRLFGGLIAEEVHEAGLTEFVQYNSDDEPDALAYGHMVSLCIKAIQEQQTLIESLTDRIAALENN